MLWSFENAEDVKEFVIHLCKVLRELGESKMADQFESWIDTCHTTSSEYLGELLEIMTPLLTYEKLLTEDRENVEILSEKIKDAFH